jgi:ABC-type transport system substrate-binding protein
VLERAALNNRVLKQPGQQGGDFMVTSVRNPVTPDDPDLQWRNFFHTKSYYTAHLADERFDKLIDAAATTYDMEQRKKLYFDLTKLAYDDPWYGYLWQQNWNWTFAKKLQNFKEPLTNRWMFTDCWLSS